MTDDVGVSCKPHVTLGPRMPDQLVKQPQPRAVADDVRMHGELEQTPFRVSGVEFTTEDIQYVLGRDLGPQPPPNGP